MQIIKLYLILINLLAFGMFVVDKWLAKWGKRIGDTPHPSFPSGKRVPGGISPSIQWRISEDRLLLTCVLGGSAGALLAMHLIRHKIQKNKFKWGVPVILLIQVAIISFVARQLVQ